MKDSPLTFSLTVIIPTTTMTNTTVCFLNLNNSNYAKWSVQMEAILVKQGLWPMVKIPISGVDADRGVKAVLMIMAELEEVKKE